MRIFPERKSWLQDDVQNDQIMVLEDANKEEK
jgi:hypothetical protein